jgi:hypothetical protein
MRFVFHLEISVDEDKCGQAADHDERYLTKGTFKFGDTLLKMRSVVVGGAFASTVSLVTLYYSSISDLTDEQGHLLRKHTGRSVDIYAR